MKVKNDENITLLQNGNESVPMDTNEPEAASLETETPSRAVLRSHETRVHLSVRGSGGGGGTSDYNELENKPQINGETLSGDKSAAELGLMPWTDLGEVDISDYDYDYWEYLNDKDETGFYRFFETSDEFDYFVRVERAGDCCSQYVWLTEEGPNSIYTRYGRWDGDGWDWYEYSTLPNMVTISNGYYSKYQTDQLLNGKVDNATLGNYYTDVQVDDILENNYYTIDQVDDLLDGFAPNNMIATTWENLVDLRDNGELQAGSFYRITDYNFITSKLGIQSGNHQFDIIVLAISDEMLSETAYAARHAGDHYFEREVTSGGIEWLYTLFVDNYADSYGDEPVDHADDLHGTDVFCDYTYDINPMSGDEVPVLFKTDADEYDFDDPDYDDMFFYSGVYDLDGDDYDMWAKYEYDYDLDELVFREQYALTPVVVVDDELTVSPIPETKTVPVNMNAWELKYCLDNDKELFGWADTHGKGVIYYLKDEFGNEAPYDFKNVMFQRRYISAVNYSYLNAFRTKYFGEQSYSYITTTSSSKYWYTFSNEDGSDGSLFGDSTYNTLEAWIVDGQKQLNDIVALLPNNNKFLNGCNTLTMQGQRNTFIGCTNLLISCGSCYIDGLRNSTLVGMSSVTFNGGYNFRGAGCGTSTFTSCWDVDLGNNLSSSVFEGGCNGITVGNYCQRLTIGAGCSNITLGQYCMNLSIGIGCANITLTNYYRFITIEDDCSAVTLNTTGGSTSSYVQYITVCKGVKNIAVQPTRKLLYETIYYKTGRVETAV